MQPRNTAEEAVAVHCRCGHGIFCTLKREGERLSLLAFFDDGPASSTCGERVEHCPGCGQRLAIHNLFTKKSP